MSRGGRGRRLVSAERVGLGACGGILCPQRHQERLSRPDQQAARWRGDCEGPTMTAPHDASRGNARIRTQAFSLADRLQSFRYAVTGIGFMLRYQHNAWVHLAISVAVCLTAWWFKVSAADWRWLIVAIVLVWVAEAMNTAFEYVCDVISPEFHVSVEKAK